MKPISSSSWRRTDQLIFIKVDDRDRRLSWRFMETVRSSSDGQDALWPASHVGDAWTSLERPISIKSRAPLDGQDDSLKNSTIAVQSNRDHGAIEPRSWIFRRGITTTISNGIHWRINIKINSQSWPDRGAIKARSWCDRGPFEARLWLNSWPIRKPWRRPKEPLPRTLQIASTTASIAHDLRANYPFKNLCISPLFLNFWSIREKIKQISRKISSSSWSPRV